MIFASYVGSFLMAEAYLAISCMTSAITRNQVVSLILFHFVICLILVLIGFPARHQLSDAIDRHRVACPHAGGVQRHHAFRIFYQGRGRFPRRDFLP